MLKVFNKTFCLLERKERFQLYRLFFAVLLTSFTEILGIASIMPFMAVISNPNVIQQNKYLCWLYNYLHFSNMNNFMVFWGIVVMALMIFNNATNAFTTWYLMKFSWNIEHSLQVRTFRNYLNRSYSYYLTRNTSDLSTNVLVEVNQFVIGFLIPGLQMLAKILLALAIISLLLTADPVLAALVIIVLGGSFGAIYSFVRGRLASLGVVCVGLNKARFKIVAEVLGGIKDIKLLGLEIPFIDKFSIPSKQYGKHQTSSQLISQLPKYIMDVIAFGGIILIVIYLLIVKHDIGKVLPFVTLYAFASYRLMPAIQQVFYGLTKIKFYLPILELLYHDLQITATDRTFSVQNDRHLGHDVRLHFKESIVLKNIMFTYQGSDKKALNDLSLSIDARSSIGIVGATGSGKTTLIDIILGLLTPTEGQIYIDKVALDSKNLRAWQRNLGYVPQHIFLSDDTIAHNIAFGVPNSEIDMEAVQRAAIIANLHEFVINLPDGYNTTVGERGVKLSGGQRQRIGIARALYRSPNVLIMDEATSALDGITENAVMDALNNVSKTNTLIMIAHRLSTVRNCDVIYLIDNGVVKAKGPYTELVNNSSLFRAMAKLGADAY